MLHRVQLQNAQNLGQSRYPHCFWLIFALTVALLTNVDGELQQVRDRRRSSAFRATAEYGEDVTRDTTALYVLDMTIRVLST